MSALNLHVGTESVTLLTDFGLYDVTTGIVVHLGPKAWVSHSLKMAIGSTGLSCVWEYLQPIADSAATQRDILAALPGVLRSLDSDARFNQSARNTRVGVAWWDERHGPLACYVVGRCGKPADEPYKLIAAQGYLQPFVEGAFVPGVALTPDTARTLIEAQRKMRHEGYYCVGGAAELITIDAKGVRDEIVHHWPEDRVGEKIDPFMPAWKRVWRSRRRAQRAHCRRA